MQTPVPEGVEAYLSLGSNLGDRHAILTSAIEAIAAHPQIFGVRHSSFHETKPVSDIPQPDFLNAAVALTTTLSAHELLHALQEIERSHGKVPKPKNAPRLLDIDIIFFGNEVHATPELEIPHPRWSERDFVLAPLSEIVATHLKSTKYEQGRVKIANIIIYTLDCLHCRGKF